MMPPKVKVTATSEKTTPDAPKGKKPPWSVRLWNPASAEGVSTSTKPRMIIATSAMTLTSDSQYSASAKMLTRAALMMSTTTNVTSAVIQWGICGNQKSRNVPMAVSSIMPTTIVVYHQFHPATKPARGPMKSRAYAANDPETGLATAISPSMRMRR
nr:Uncharacterised protein [Streptococcus thermophilus]